MPHSTVIRGYNASDGAFEPVYTDGSNALLVSVTSTTPGAETVVAGAASTLGKIAAPVNTETIYIRQATGSAEYIDWLVKSNTVHTVQKYKSRTIANTATITLAAATRVDDTDTFTLNGLTYTAESTAGDAAYASRKWKSGGADITADAAALAALINADWAVATAGTSVAATDKLIITTDEGAHTIIAAATADYPAGQYGLSATVATELASIVLAINHSQNVTCATSVDGDTVTINGVTFTSAAAQDLTAREFDNDASDNATATSLAACINDATYGVSGVTATASANVVMLHRDSEADVISLSSSDGTTLACVTTVGGVPGVVAAATGATGELSITPTWTAVLTVTEAGDQLTVTDIDVPGIFAAPAVGVITLTCTTPGGPTGGEKASTIQFGQGNSDAAEIAFVDNTLASLAIDGAVTTDAAANSTTAGTIYTQTMNGWEYGYIGLTNKSGSGAMTAVVGATLR